MTFFNFPIKRPVTVLMGMIIIIILSALSWYRIPLNLIPDISFPNLMVFIRYDNANPKKVEEHLDKILEGAIKSTPNIKNVKVTAQEEICFINTEFN